MTSEAARLHVYAYPWQPFTNFDHCGFRRRHKANDTRFHCYECLDRRAAKNLEIQAYYDEVFIRCKDGKHPGWS